MLKDFFFAKEDKEDESSSTVLNCKQLFCSTHSFDFFGLLRELPNPKKTKKFFYFTKRINPTESTFTNLPKALRNYTSEYHYLFELIYQFDKSDKKEELDFMGLPNAVRRFVELYTYSRIPGHYNQSNVDDRAAKLWGAEESKRILKVFHYFSHSNNITRMLTNSDLICDIENAVSDLLGFIKKDKDHYKELERALSS